MTDAELFQKFEAYAREHGWTLEEAGRNIGVARSSIFNYKNGRAISPRARRAMLLLITEPATAEASTVDPLTRYITDSVMMFLPSERAEVVALIEQIKERKKQSRPADHPAAKLA